MKVASSATRRNGGVALAAAGTSGSASRRPAVLVAVRGARTVASPSRVPTPAPLVLARAASENTKEDSVASSVLDISEDGDDLPLYTNFSDALEPWQLLVLEEAYVADPTVSAPPTPSFSILYRPIALLTNLLTQTHDFPARAHSQRRKLSITSLSEEVKLSRSQVLDWLKSRSTLPPDRVETIRAACLAAIEREERLEETLKKKAAKREFAGMSVSDRRKARSKDQKMSPLALKTLLKVWGRNRNPSWQSVNDIARVTKLSPSVVRGWFSEKRREEGGGDRATPGRAGAHRRRRRRKV